MLRGLYTAAFGMINNQNKQDVNSFNISNAQTIGYKEDKIVSKTFPEVMLQNIEKNYLDDGYYKKLGRLPLGVKVDEVYTNYKQGDITYTQNDYDFAIEGRGYFPIMYFDGIKNTISYTRNGRFEIDGGGNITSFNGGSLLVKDNTGKIVPLNTNGESMTVDTEGNIYINDEKKFSFVLYDFSDYNKLERYGPSYYTYNSDEKDGPIEVNDEETKIFQKSLEESNVDITEQMVNMITNLRNYQASQKVLQVFDETLQKAVNDIGSLK